MYAEAMLLPVFNAHMEPQCTVGVGVAEHSHLLQDNSNILSRERKSERRKETEEEKVSKKGKDAERLHFINVRKEKNDTI